MRSRGVIEGDIDDGAKAEGGGVACIQGHRLVDVGLSLIDTPHSQQLPGAPYVELRVAVCLRNQIQLSQGIHMQDRLVVQGPPNGVPWADVYLELLGQRCLAFKHLGILIRCDQIASLGIGCSDESFEHRDPGSVGLDLHQELRPLHRSVDKIRLDVECAEASCEEQQRAPENLDQGTLIVRPSNNELCVGVDRDLFARRQELESCLPVLYKNSVADAHGNIQDGPL